MDITGSNLSILFTNASIAWQQALQTTPTFYKEISTVMPSSTSQNLYAWLDRFPAMRRWLGDRVMNTLATHSRTVVNAPFELTNEILAEHIRHDQYGVFNFNVQFLGQQAAKWPDQTLVDYLVNRAAAACSNPVNGFDGKTLFATDHPTLGGDVVGGVPSSVASTQSNLYTSTALTYDNYVAVRTNMASLKGADGQPLNNWPDTLIVPPQLEGKGKNILEADFLAGVNTINTAPQSNVYKGTAQLKVIQELSVLPNIWYMMCTKSVVKPLIWQQEMAPRFTYLINPTDINVFMARKFFYGIEAWGEAAESMWFLAAAATSASTYTG